MDRRTYLGSLSAAGVAGIAGCLDTLGTEDDSRTALDPPDQDIGDPSHPIHGEEFPSVTLTDPLNETTVSTDDLEGKNTYLMTFFFTNCPAGVCPALMLRLRRVQEDAAERGYSDDVSLLAVTIDPERDTPEVLETYADQQGVDADADNWHFLRPESNEAAMDLVNETLGVPIERVDDPDEANHGYEGGGSDTASDGDGANASDGNESDGNESDGGHEGGHGEYTFTHYDNLFLVNDEGIVERSYPMATSPASDRGVEADELVEATRTVVND